MSALDQQVAIVTGAGRGIGRATATRLAAEGARVLVNDIDEHVCRSTAEEIGAVAVPGDLTDPDMPQRMVAAALGTFGRLDVLVNNAGWVEVAAIRDIDSDRWLRMIAVNLDASYLLLREVGAAFIRQRREGDADQPGHHRKIVNVSSIAGLDGVAGAIHYGAAKAGVIGMTKSAAKEWGKHAINVNAVAFGLIETRLTAGTAVEETGGSAMPVRPWAGARPPEELAQVSALGRAGSPAEAANAIFFLCSPDSDYVSGHVLRVDGGQV
ncbi:SDR family NAD(P)-dependent oxidoreductase [Nocardioides sp. LHD-245]|uniref:SDR family NAD(P)-dependent oxidoreductase n=1 Tax=Nocardioides sp. LHD-245 TaxID=3051387 RepID=UPI0027E0D815|nr:SDR family NAD(P)-dependent oxidoreductase [Nocardioides sp. LHD-245]